MIDAYITNLGKYNEGDLCGEYLKLPATKEDVKALFSRIGIDGVLYEEFFITDYETRIKGLHGILGEYENIDELNYLAAMLSDLDEREVTKFEAALEYEDHISCVEQLINLAQNLDCYDLQLDVNTHEELGLSYAERLETLSIPEHLEYYIDFEAYGRDIEINEGGVFTDNGYITRNGNDFIEHYKGFHVPDQYRIFAFPDKPEKMPIYKQLEMFSRMASSKSMTEKSVPSRDER